MTDKKSSESRRKLLKSIAAGSGAVIAGKSLPDEWIKPVVDSVVLPVHAQTSGLRNYFGPAIAQTEGASFQNGMMLATVTGGLINDAHAGGPVIGEPNGTLCAAETADGIEVQYQNRNNTVLRKGALPKTGEVTSLNYFDASPAYKACEEPDGEWDISARVIAITDDYFELEIKHANRGWVTYRVAPDPSCAMPTLDGDQEC